MLSIFLIYVTVGMDKPLARLIAVRRLSVDNTILSLRSTYITIVQSTRETGDIYSRCLIKEWFGFKI